MEDTDLDCIKKIRDLSDKELAEILVSSVRLAIERNTPKIKSSAVLSRDFSTVFNLQLDVSFFDKDSVSVKTLGCFEPVLFEAVKTSRKWTKD